MLVWTVMSSWSAVLAQHAVPNEVSSAAQTPVPDEEEKRLNKMHVLFDVMCDGISVSTTTTVDLKCM